MAPSLEEPVHVEVPVQVNFEAPLKAAPKLVAPEPGMFAPPPQDSSRTQVIPGYTGFSQKISCKVLQAYVLGYRLRKPLEADVHFPVFSVCKRAED
jgi:hypothetical protein